MEPYGAESGYNHQHGEIRHSPDDGNSNSCCSSCWCCYWDVVDEGRAGHVKRWRRSRNSWFAVTAEIRNLSWQRNCNKTVAPICLLYRSSSVVFAAWKKGPGHCPTPHSTKILQKKKRKEKNLQESLGDSLAISWLGWFSLGLNAISKSSESSRKENDRRRKMLISCCTIHDSALSGCFSLDEY